MKCSLTVNPAVVLEKGFWRVLVGRETTEDAAEALAAKIRQNSPEKKSAFVVRIEGAT